MPRIRKKTSRRQSLAQREKIKHKARESRKKRAKAAKKDPQWKSKHKKDPGIPNSFPYKDQILAEVAEQRRIAAEEKQRRKDEKKAAKALPDGAEDQDGGASDAEDADAGAAFDGVRAMPAARTQAAGRRTRDDVGEEEEEEADDEAPALLNPDLPNLRAVLAAADVVVHVLDARDPAATRSAHLEEVARELGKRLVLVLSKIDACPREAVEAWAAALRQEHPTLLFRAASACLPAAADAAAQAKGKGKGKTGAPADNAWGTAGALALLSHLAAEKAQQGDPAPLAVAIVGVTNSGKTAFVNALLRRAALPTYVRATVRPDAPTTTPHPQEVELVLEGGARARLIDTPGVAWCAAEDADEGEAARLRARDILVRNRGHVERLKDPAPVLSELVSRATREDLMLLYNLPIFTEGDANAFLAGVARANGFAKKKGDPDLAGAARMVLRDWSSGKLARYTVPATPSPPAAASTSTSASTEFADIYAQDAAVLVLLTPRKELRKAGGLVRLRAPPTPTDTRRVALDESYFSTADGDGDDDTDDESGEDVAIDDEDGSEDLGDEDSEEDEDEDENDEESGSEDEDADEDEEDELASSPPHGKRKRVSAKAPARPAKRVAFAPEPKGTKQARSAAGAKSAPTKARAKAAAAPKPKPARKPAKVANAASGRASKTHGAAVKDGETAYDFSRFF